MRNGEQERVRLEDHLCATWRDVVRPVNQIIGASIIDDWPVQRGRENREVVPADIIDWEGGQLKSPLND